MTETVLKRLRELQHLKTGDPMPSWLPANDWGNPLSDLCGQAADRIEELEQRLERMRVASQRIW